MALTHTQKLNEAQDAVRKIQELAADTVLKIPFSPFSPAIDGVNIALDLLRGSIALQENNMQTAIEAFQKAVLTETGMVYNEPRDWLLNPRHYLANAYIRAGRFTEAEKTLKEDLAVNNENGWALYGYWQVLLGQHKKKEAAIMKTRFEKAFNKADIKLNGTVF